MQIAAVLPQDRIVVISITVELADLIPARKHGEPGHAHHGSMHHQVALDAH